LLRLSVVGQLEQRCGRPTREVAGDINHAEARRIAIRRTGPGHAVARAGKDARSGDPDDDRRTRYIARLIQGSIEQGVLERYTAERSFDRAEQDGAVLCKLELHPSTQRRVSEPRLRATADG